MLLVALNLSAGVFHGMTFSTNLISFFIAIVVIAVEKRHAQEHTHTQARARTHTNTHTLSFTVSAELSS